MKFLVDKALSQKTVTFLRNQGYISNRVNKVIIHERVSDLEIFKYAKKNNYIIISADVDFGELLAETKSKKPSIILFRVTDQRVSNINELLKKNIPFFKKELASGSLINIEDYGVKIHELPI